MQTHAAVASARATTRRAEDEPSMRASLASATQFRDAAADDDQRHRFIVEAGDTITFYIPYGTPLANAEVQIGGMTLRLTSDAPSQTVECNAAGVIDARFTTNLQFRHLRGSSQIDPPLAAASTQPRAAAPATPQASYQPAPVQRDGYLRDVERERNTYARMTELRGYASNVAGASARAGSQTGVDWETIQFALDIIGMFDQTGFSDAASCVIAVAMGDYSGAFWSALALVPLAGAAAALPKITAYLRKKGFTKLVDWVTSNATEALGVLNRALTAAKDGMVSAVKAADNLSQAVVDAFQGVKRSIDDVLTRETQRLEMATPHGNAPWTKPQPEANWSQSRGRTREEIDAAPGTPSSRVAGLPRDFGTYEAKLKNQMLTGDSTSIDIHCGTADEALAVFRQLKSDYGIHGNDVPENSVAWSEGNYEKSGQGYSHADVVGGGGHDSPHYQLHLPMGTKYLVVRIHY